MVIMVLIPIKTICGKDIWCNMLRSESNAVNWQLSFIFALDISLKLHSINAPWIPVYFRPCTLVLAKYKYASKFAIYSKDFISYFSCLMLTSIYLIADKVNALNYLYNLNKVVYYFKCYRGTCIKESIKSVDKCRF